MPKIALTVKSEGNNELVIDERFGRAERFLVYDTETDTSEIIENPNVNAAHGAGIQTANFVADMRVAAVISVNFGPKASATLSARNIRMFQAYNMSVNTAIENFKANKLPEFK